MKWSSAELALLSDHAKADDIAKTIGRSLSSIRSMADRLKIYLVMPDSYYAEVRKNKIHKEVNCIICGTKFTQKNKHNTMCGSQECFRQNQRNIQNKNNRNFLAKALYILWQ